MSIWIRSQDKETIIEASYIDTGGEENNEIYAGTSPQEGDVVAHYATEARALEVMDEIERYIDGRQKENIMIGKEIMSAESIEKSYETMKAKAEAKTYEPAYFSSAEEARKSALHYVETNREAWLMILKAYPNGWKYNKVDPKTAVFQMPKE